MKNVSDKFEQTIKTHILCSKTLSRNRVFYDIMWKNIVGPERSQMTI